MDWSFYALFNCILVILMTGGVYKELCAMKHHFGSDEILSQVRLEPGTQPCDRNC